MMHVSVLLSGLMPAPASHQCRSSEMTLLISSPVNAGENPGVLPLLPRNGVLALP